MRNPKQDENKYWFCSNYQKGRATERALILQLLVTRGRLSDICALHVTSQIKLSVSVLIMTDDFKLTDDSVDDIVSTLFW